MNTHQPHNIPENREFAVADSWVDLSPQSLVSTVHLSILHDDENLVAMAGRNTKLSTEFEESHCQRLLFVFLVVYQLCKMDHDLAVQTWIRLVDGEHDEDIWLWADDDEGHAIDVIRNNTKNRLHRTQADRYSGGWKLTEADIRAGITALSRRIARVRKGEKGKLETVEVRTRLHDVTHPSLRFAAISWAIATSQAMKDVHRSRDNHGQRYLSLIGELDDIIFLPTKVNDVILSEMRPKLQSKYTFDVETSQVQVSLACKIYF